MRLIVVDDDRLVVDSLKIILGAQPQIEVVGTGANGDDAVALYAEHAPDIALLDIQMPGRDGLSAAREILERDPAARVVFLTTFSDDEYIVSALKLGARGYLIKIGSSASTIAGLVIRARAIATRCCCPPERLFGMFFSLSSSPSR